MNKTAERKKGQTTLEYGVLIAAICAAVITMQFYIHRSVSGHIKQGADEIGQQFDYWEADSLTNTTVKLNSTIKTNTTQPDPSWKDAQGYPIYAIEYEINETQNVTREGYENIYKR